MYGGRQAMVVVSASIELPVYAADRVGYAAVEDDAMAT